MKEEDLTTEVVEHLFTLVEHLREGFGRAAARAELSAAQAKALRHLAVAGPVAMRDLASRMHCDASNVTGIIDRLEERGLVVRRVADGDRRVKSLVVTPDGRHLAEAMWRQVCQQAAAVLEMSDEESAGFALLLRRAGSRCATNGTCPTDGAPLTTRGRRAPATEGAEPSARPPAERPRRTRGAATR